MDLLAITSYYNPFHGKARKANYDVFRRHLGIPLLTVEWSQHGDFDLCDDDADYLIQVSRGDLLWQKERLLNIGLAEARSLGFSRVAFLDSDIVFHDPAWFRTVDAALDSFSIVQCFSRLDYLPAADYSSMSRQHLLALQPEFSNVSLSFEMLQHCKCSSGQRAAFGPVLASSSYSGNPGMAIAIRFDEHLEWKHYEGNIVGGGDSVLMAAVTNRLDQMFQNQLFTNSHQESIRAWKEEYFPENIRWGCADNQLAHLWHGEIENRQYLTRHEILVRWDYDPASDLSSESSGALTLADSNSRLKEHIAEYLVSRKDC